MGVGDVWQSAQELVAAEAHAAERVSRVVEALDAVDEAWLRERYRALDRPDYGQPFSDEDFQHTWESLCGLRRFLAQAAVEGSSIVFAVAE